MSFLNVVAIESALKGLAAKYPDVATLIPLPFKTHEGRQSHALAIGVGSRCPAAGVLILGGVHARERGGPDICINLAADLLEAHAGKTGLLYGGLWFSPDEIRTIVERVDLIVFPAVNPDGIHHAQTVNENWRKNRNPASSGGSPSRIGVDVNRNFDILWDFQKAFHPEVSKDDTVGSVDPSSDQFHGTAPFSEPESRNVRWLLETSSHITHFVDVHSHRGTILHAWGQDENQSHSPQMNFTNSVWDWKRGRHKDAYGEYIPPDELESLVWLGNEMSGAIAAVRGQSYSVTQSYFMPDWIGTFATSGASDDWAFSRHFADSRKRQVLAFTLEFNRQPTFTPTWAEMEPIIAEVDAGLLRLCLNVAPRFKFPSWLCSGFRWWLTLPIFPPRFWDPYGPWDWLRRPFRAVLRLFTRPLRRSRLRDDIGSQPPGR